MSTFAANDVVIFCSDVRRSKRNGQAVRVLESRDMGEKLETGYLVHFVDGWETVAMESELSSTHTSRTS